MNIETSQLINFIKDTMPNGIPIEDAFTWKSALMNATMTIPASIIGAFLGSKVTIWIFKNQESIRIKQDLRMRFFNKYESKYRDVEGELIKLEEKLEDIKSEIIYLNIETDSLLDNIDNIKSMKQISSLLTKYIHECYQISTLLEKK